MAVCRPMYVCWRIVVESLASNLLNQFCSNFQNLHKICILGQSARQVMLNNIKNNISFWPKCSTFFIRCTIFKVYLKYLGLRAPPRSLTSSYWTFRHTAKQRLKGMGCYRHHFFKRCFRCQFWLLNYCKQYVKKQLWIISGCSVLMVVYVKFESM